MHNQFKTQKFKHLMLAMGPRDLNSAPYSPVHCSSHSMTSFQSSELTELPVVENSQLFAQRAHSARYAPHTVDKAFFVDLIAEARVADELVADACYEASTDHEDDGSVSEVSSDTDGVSEEGPNGAA